MAEEFHVYLQSTGEAVEAERRLAAMRVGDRPALVVRRDGSGLFCGCKVHGALGKDASISTPTGARVPFFDLFYQVEGVKSGMHHPDGLLWIRTPERTHVVHREPLPLTEVFPALLALLGLPPQRHTPPPGARIPVPEISTGPRADVVARTM